MSGVISARYAVVCISFAYGSQKLCKSSVYLFLNKKRYIQFCHRNECCLKMVKVDLGDRSTPQYVIRKR